MKIKVVIVLLAVACVGLAVAFFATKKQSDEQHEKDVGSIVVFSNQLMDAEVKINDLNQVNLAFSNDLTTSQQQLSLSKEQLAQLSNSLASANTTLAGTKATLASTRTTLAGAQEQINNLNIHISDLEAQNKVLDQRAGELTNTISRLSAMIDDTRSRLAISLTNSVFLQDELQKQMAQKAELEHKFNDLDELRSQVRKMRDEMFMARRLQLMKNDNGNKKGAELLLQRTVTVTATNDNPPAKVPAVYDLNVEVGSDGSVKVIPPLGARTNSAAH